MERVDVSGTLRTLKRLISFGGGEIEEINRPVQDMNMEGSDVTAKLKHKKSFVLFKIHEIEMKFPVTLAENRINQIHVFKTLIQKAQNECELARYYRCWKNLALELDKEAKEKKMADGLRKTEILNKVTLFYEQHPHLNTEEKLHLLKLKKNITDAHDSAERNEKYFEWLEYTNKLYRKETSCLRAQNKRLKEDKSLLEAIVDLFKI